MKGEKIIDRNPRENAQRPVVNDVVIDPPPKIDSARKEKISPIIIQCLTAIINFSLVSFLISKDISISLLSAAITSLGSLFTVLTTNIIENKRWKKQCEDIDNRYRNYLDGLHKIIRNNRVSLDKYYETNYPAVYKYLLTNEIQPKWDRFIGEDDYLSVRIGHQKTREFTVVYNGDPEFERGEKASIEELCNCGYTNTAPVLIDIKGEAIGFWGQRDSLVHVFNSVLLDCVFHQSYSDLKLIVIEPDGYYSWLSDLPFFLDDSEDLCLYASTNKEITKVISYIERIREKRENSKLSGGIATSSPIPNYVICVFDEKIVRHPLFSSLIESKGLSISLLLFFRNFSTLPPAITKIKCENDESIIFDKSVNVRFEIEKIDHKLVAKYVKELSSYQSETLGGFLLPKNVGLLEGLGVTKLEKLDIVKRWKSSKRKTSLSVPVGIDELGQVFEIDFHEQEAGPHCLIAGTTGSGKTEFLSTLVLSYAINYPPERVSFWIIDGKGIGFSPLLKQLPHKLKFISNFDEETNNVIVNELKAELYERQQLFRSIGVSNIDQYNRIKGQSLPHLFILLDEFAEIKCYYPELLQSIMSIARIGRSMGVHLIMSTQSPMGSISESLYANCKSRISFRMVDKINSASFLGAPVTSSFTNPGRAALRIGDGIYSIFQAFWLGSDFKILSQDEDSIVKYISKQHVIYLAQNYENSEYDTQKT